MGTISSLTHDTCLGSEGVTIFIHGSSHRIGCRMSYVATSMITIDVTIQIYLPKLALPSLDFGEVTHNDCCSSSSSSKLFSYAFILLKQGPPPISIYIKPSKTTKSDLQWKKELNRDKT